MRFIGRYPSYHGIPFTADGHLVPCRYISASLAANCECARGNLTDFPQTFSIISTVLMKASAFLFFFVVLSFLHPILTMPLFGGLG